MELFVFFSLLVIALVALIRSIRIINQYEKGVILRLGKFHTTADAGLTILVPFVDSLMTVDMREKVINVEPQKVITKDNVSVVVDAVIYYKVVDPVKAEFEVEDFGTAATTLAQTNLRNLVGDKTLDETLTARDVINSSLREVLDEATHNWGVKVTRVEVQKIDPPEDITHAMSQQMKAEREKRASILQSEGIKQSQILEAEGEAKAKILRAEAEATAVKAVAEAAEKYFGPKAQKLKQLEVSASVLKDSTKWVIPSNSDLINILGSEGNIIPVKK